MNKLVSKNSILRFKLGRKIEKLQKGRYIKVGRSTFGDTIWADTTTGDLYKGNLDPNDPHSHYSKGWMEPGGKGHLGKSATYYNLISGRGTINGSDYIRKSNSTNQQQLLQTTDYSWMKGGTRLRSAEEQKKWEAEVQRLKNLMKNDPRKVINKQRITPRFLSKYANMANTIGGANNIRAWLQKLKNYYAPGTYNPDSVWGDNTQAAYERYLAEQNNNLGLVKLEPVSISPVKESVLQNDFAQDKQTGYPSMETIQSSNPVLNLQNDFASDRQNYYPSATMSTPSTETVPVLQNDFASQKSSGYQSDLSRGAQLFSNITLRPEFKKYGYWRILNTNPFTIYSKQGSKLVYKNPVKRFKSNFR